MTYVESIALKYCSCWVPSGGSTVSCSHCHRPLHPLRSSSTHLRTFIRQSAEQTRRVMGALLGSSQKES